MAVWRDARIEGFSDEADSDLCPLPYMGTWMEVVELSRAVFEALKIVGKGLPGKGEYLGLGGRKIERIRGMKKDGRDIQFRVEVRLEFHFRKRLYSTSSGVSSKRLKGIGSD